MIEVTAQQLEKFENLKKYLKDLGSVAVAFSSGVDSTFLLKAAQLVLGDQAIAVTVRATSFPKREMEEAAEFCKKEGIRQVFSELDEMSIEGFSQNPKDRCYFCKKEIFRHISDAAASQGITCIAEGSNMDDLGDYRPGLRAIEELGIKSPLRDCQLYKEDIRALSKYLGLPTWKKPSYACLASRFVYGETITEEKLFMVDRAEQLLLDLGFEQMRVRIHGTMARIELLPQDFPRMLDEDFRTRIYEAFREIGFSYVTMDLKGYRTGSMNETITEAGKTL